MKPIDRLDWLTRAYRVGQIIRTAALFGVCDVLADERLGAEQVAGRVGAAVDPMRRLLRTLVALDVLRESDGLFSNAAMGELLRRDDPEAMREVAISRMRDPWWRAWGALPEAVRGGECAYVLANGRSLWEDLGDDPDAAASFNAMIGSGIEEYASSLVQSVQFTDVRRFVDVGGGQGTMLAALLRAAPGARGTLFDRPAGLIGAEDYLAAAGWRTALTRWPATSSRRSLRAATSTCCGGSCTTGLMRMHSPSSQAAGAPSAVSQLACSLRT
jgi:O-methyltransferase domain/Dimerisation domain